MTKGAVEGEVPNGGGMGPDMGPGPGPIHGGGGAGNAEGIEGPGVWLA